METEVTNIEVNKTSAKQKKTLTKKKHSLIAVFNGNKYIDVDTEFKWSHPLTDAQKLFVVYWCSQSSLKKNAAEAARQAGYSVKTAKTQAEQLLRKPLIIAEIKNINSQFLKSLTKLDLETTVKDIIARKQARLNMQPHEFYDIELKHSDKGFEYIDATMKTPDELTDEQKALIEDIEYVGQKSIPHYKLPSKVQTENELLKIYKDFTENEQQTDDYEVETTAEIIKGNLQVKTKVMRANAEIVRESDLNNKTTQRTEED